MESRAAKENVVACVFVFIAFWRIIQNEIRMGTAGGEWKVVGCQIRIDLVGRVTILKPT